SKNFSLPTAFISAMSSVILTYFRMTLNLGGLSASRASRAGSQESRALQALRKKIDRGNEAFSGLPKTQEAANDLIRQTLGAKNPIIRTRTRNGQTIRDVFDQATGRGVRTIDGEFDTFVNLK
ncbi:MAG: hypothetical protein Q8L45_01115, partial [Xanthomonadaceae bacterium]|nr:hypothetical protein [Xanthomonadaceae bacterium]